MFAITGPRSHLSNVLTAAGQEGLSLVCVFRSYAYMLLLSVTLKLLAKT